MKNNKILKKAAGAKAENIGRNIKSYSEPLSEDEKKNLSVLQEVYNRRKNTKKVLAAAGVSFSLCAIILISTPNPIRAKIYQFILFQTIPGDTYTEFVTNDGNMHDLKGWYWPSYLPEEFTLKSIKKVPNIIILEFVRNEKQIILTESNTTLQVDTEDADSSFISLDKGIAFLYEKNNRMTLVWNVDNYMMTLDFQKGTLNNEQMREIANHLCCIS